MPITSGSIRYERRLPKDDANSWNYKHVVSEIHWTVEPDEMEEDLAAYAVDKVVRRVKDVLNWKPAVPDDQHEAAAISNQVEVPDLATAVAEITAGIPPALKRHRRTKAEMEAARAAQPDPTLPGSNSTSSSTENMSEPGTPMVSSSTAEPGMPSFDPEPLPPAEVTDPDLQNACHARASSGTPIANIKELIAKFSPGGLPLIPQDARRRFLEELAKL